MLATNTYMNNIVLPTMNCSKW